MPLPFPPATRQFRSLGLSATIWLAVLLPTSLAPAGAAPADGAAARAAVVAPLLMRDLAGVAGKEVLMITVTYPPGVASLPHRHDAQVFVYVLEGELRMQVRGAAEVIVKPGDTFYEGPDDVHQVSANASSTAPAKLLVFMVKDKSRPPSRDATP
jgi:quercetin dioxygenase-like cupin family protein